VGLTRQKNLLKVTIAAPISGTTPTPRPTWTALLVSRQLLGRPLPRRIDVVAASSR
jgi:hypothetical protein